MRTYTKAGAMFWRWSQYTIYSSMYTEFLEPISHKLRHIVGYVHKTFLYAVYGLNLFNLVPDVRNA